MKNPLHVPIFTDLAFPCDGSVLSGCPKSRRLEPSNFQFSDSFEVWPALSCGDRCFSLAVVQCDRKKVNMMNSDVQGRVEAVLDRLIAEGIDRGIQVAAYRNGELIADAWAGVADPFTEEPVKAETLFPVFSVTKGISATVIHRLAERGLLSYDMRIAEVWPEFGVNGKETITLRQAMMHTAGIPELPPALTFAQMLDWTSACEQVAQMTPKWSPGTQFAYHAKMYGWLLGEVARRVDGRFFTDLVHEEIARPLGLETLHVGLKNPGKSPVAYLAEKELGTRPRPSFGELSGREAAQVPMMDQMNTRETLAACLPSSNGTMNARAIARHYASLLPGGVDGVELLPPPRVAVATEWSTRMDPANQPATWGLGYMRNEVPTKAGKLEAFGHGGYGGSMGFAIPQFQLAVGYTRNLLGPESGWEKIIGALIEE